MKGPAVETAEATLVEIKALLDELLECTAECAHLGNPSAGESTAEIRDRWRQEAVEQAPACPLGAWAATVHVSANLTAEDTGVLGTAHQVLDGMPLPDMTAGTEDEGGAIYLQPDETLAGKDFEVFTTVGGLSLFLELGLDFADQMFDGITLKDVVLAEEMPDDVLTHVGGISLFFELGLDMPSGVEYDTDAWQCLTLLLGSRHLLFADGTYDATPPKWPLQEHNKMWQWIHVLPPWGQSGVSPGQDGINSIYHVFQTLSPWISNASSPKRSAIQVSMMFCAKVSSWQRSGFSPGKEGRERLHSVFHKLPSWRHYGFHPGRRNAVSNRNNKQPNIMRVLHPSEKRKCQLGLNCDLLLLRSRAWRGRVEQKSELAELGHFTILQQLARWWDCLCDTYCLLFDPGDVDALEANLVLNASLFLDESDARYQPTWPPDPYIHEVAVSSSFMVSAYISRSTMYMIWSHYSDSVAVGWCKQVPDIGLMESAIATRALERDLRFRIFPYLLVLLLSTKQHDILLSLMFINTCLQLPWDPGGTHSRDLRASRVSRGRECNARTCWESGPDRHGPWTLDLGPALRGLGGMDASEYIDGRSCREKGIEEMKKLNPGCSRGLLSL